MTAGTRQQAPSDGACCHYLCWGTMNMRSKLQAITPVLLLAPFLLLLLLVCVSLLRTVLQSLGYMPEVNQTALTLKYWASMLQVDSLPGEAGRSIGLSLLTSLVVAVLGVLLAWCITTVYEGKGIFFHISKIPMLMPYTVTCLCATTLLTSTGVLSRILTAMGWVGAQDFFGGVLFQPNSLGVLIVFGFNLTSYFAFMTMGVMNRISGNLGEASMNLGASTWSTFKNVLLPNCMPTIRHTFIFVFVIVFGNYEVPKLVGSNVDVLLPVASYIEYGSINIIPHRPNSMVINVILLILALAVVLIVHLWDTHDKKKRGLK